MTVFVKKWNNTKNNETAEKYEKKGLSHSKRYYWSALMLAQKVRFTTNHKYCCHHSSDDRIWPAAWCRVENLICILLEPNSRSRKLNLESIDEKKNIDTCAEQVKESLKLMIKEALFEKDGLHQQEVEALRMQIIELKSSQEFICLKYDNLKVEYDRLTL